MPSRERELIAHLLGDAAPSAATRAWLATAAGQKSLASHRRALAGLDAWGAVTKRAPTTRRQTTRPAENDEPIVYVGALTTPVGRVLAAIGPKGVVGISFGGSASTFGATLARRHRVRVVRADARLGKVKRELGEYFGGRRRRLTLPVDLAGVSPFQRRVLAAARRVPAGRVVSYGELARRIGRPGAGRAVGQALGHNPIPIIIPCHRIVAGGGGLGGYVGGAKAKRTLLALEGVQGMLRPTGT
ncbi:MAG: methylated-DNA--[protein]-cysteine S-methyltransferase [Candidatus Binatia bacterium]